MQNGKMVRVGISLTPDLLESFDKLISSRGYATRSEAFRDMIREKAVEDEWKENQQVAGTVTLVYNHEQQNITETLTELQHHHLKRIVSTMHVHLDEHNCLEVLVIRGKAKDVKALGDKLLSQKGVKHGKIVMTTTGKELS